EREELLQEENVEERIVEEQEELPQEELVEEEVSTEYEQKLYVSKENERRKEKIDNDVYAYVENIITRERVEEQAVEEVSSSGMNQEEGIIEEIEEDLKSNRKDNEFYLTQLFNEEEENFRKVRVYIVQKGETVQSIAAKCDIQVQQIT